MITVSKLSRKSVSSLLEICEALGIPNESFATKSDLIPDIMSQVAALKNQAIEAGMASDEVEDIDDPVELMILANNAADNMGDPDDEDVPLPQPVDDDIDFVGPDPGFEITDPGDDRYVQPEFNGIPVSVLEDFETIRQMGVINMMNRRGFLEICSYETEEWLGSDKSRYAKILITFGDWKRSLETPIPAPVEIPAGIIPGLRPLDECIDESLGDMYAQGAMNEPVATLSEKFTSQGDDVTFDRTLVNDEEVDKVWANVFTKTVEGSRKHFTWTDCYGTQWEIKQVETGSWYVADGGEHLFINASKKVAMMEMTRSVAQRILNAAIAGSKDFDSEIERLTFAR